MATTFPIRMPAPAEHSTATPRVVVVHAGARDAYQVALALEEAGMLEKLVTDLFWPADRGWARSLSSHLPFGLRTLLAQRSAKQLPSSKVKLCALDGMTTWLLDRLKSTPLGLRRAATRRADAALGRTAGRLARTTGAGLLSYSYYGHEAFQEYGGQYGGDNGGAGMLFQMHPHPASMRRILRAELQAHPECAASLEQEWELALPEEDFQKLVRETAMARHFLAASSFTRSTLVENGVAGEAIRVVPYGVDAARFRPDPTRRTRMDGKLRLLFVGRINQRKGIKDLLDAIRMVNSERVELMVCGRVVDDLSIFKEFSDRVILRPNVNAEELVAAYQAADLFVFPSLAEGFGQVLLESLASGLPILSTSSTAAPDLIESGRQGFVVEPGDAGQLAEHIDWALSHRRELEAMRGEARLLAEEFTWQRFRTGIVAAVCDFLAAPQSVGSSPLRKKPMPTKGRQAHAL